VIVASVEQRTIARYQLLFASQVDGRPARRCTKTSELRACKRGRFFFLAASCIRSPFIEIESAARSSICRIFVLRLDLLLLLNRPRRGACAGMPHTKVNIIALRRSVDEKIFQRVLALGWGERFFAYPAMNREARKSRLRTHPNDLVS
jgi:hypothetical protein